MSQGWVKVHRQLLNWEWYDDMNTKCLYLHCLLRANHSNAKWRGIDIKRGQFITSLESLSSETGLSVQKIRTSLIKLKSTGNITSKQQAKARVITVLNYDSYQDDNKQTNKQLTGKQQGSNREVTTDKNDKNNKNVNIPYDGIKDIYNEVLSELAGVKLLNETRKRSIKARWNSKIEGINNLEWWGRYFNYVKTSDFLMGKKTDWSADFDFLIKESSLLKTIEGGYDNAK